MQETAERLERLSTICRELQVLYDMRDDMTRDLRQAGTSVATLCDITGLTRARIYQLLEKGEEYDHDTASPGNQAHHSLTRDIPTVAAGSCDCEHWTHPACDSWPPS